MSRESARFDALVRAFSPDLYRYAFWLCRERATAEDLVQETFLRAWRSFGSLKDERATKSWLMTILRREHARTFERQRPEPADMDFDSLPGPLTQGAITPEALTVRRALYELPRRYREPLALQVLLGHSAEEIAAIMNLTPAAVLTRVHRARQKLRAALQDEPAGAGERTAGRAASNA